MLVMCSSRLNTIPSQKLFFIPARFHIQHVINVFCRHLGLTAGGKRIRDCDAMVEQVGDTDVSSVDIYL